MPLNILGNFGQSLTVPLMNEQAGITVRLSDGGFLSISPGFGLVAGQAVGVVAGAANVNAVGASIAAAAGSSTGLSVVAATSGAAGATEAVGTAAGLAMASGVGASVAASVGASAGAATAAAVGSSGAANEAAGTAAGIAAGSAVGAPRFAAVASAAGVATASAGGASTVARLGISDAAATVSGVGEAVSGGDAYAVGGNSPEVVADFVGDYYRKAGSDSTFAGVLSFSRSSTAHYLNSSGVWTSVSSGTDRRGHHIYNGSSWVNSGMRYETEARTNLLLNSGTLSTQSVTVTAVAHTLHFSGTGTITLSGASTAGPLVGTGTGENNRVSLTFTPSAGSLTLTVSGTVTNAQLEVGSTASSYIPTSGSTVTRAAEALSIPEANTAPSTTAVSMQMDGRMTYADRSRNFATGGAEVGFIILSAGFNSQIRIGIDSSFSKTGELEAEFRNGSTFYSETSASYFSPGMNVAFNWACRLIPTRMNLAENGTALTETTVTGSIPDWSASNLTFGNGSTDPFMGTIGQFRLWEDVDLGNTGIADATA